MATRRGEKGEGRARPRTWGLVLCGHALGAGPLPPHSLPPSGCSRPSSSMPSSSMLLCQQAGRGSATAGVRLHFNQREKTFFY